MNKEEIEELEDMELELNKLISLVPKDLKAGQEVIKECPNCGAKLKIAKVSINGHLWIICEKEGVLLCE